MNDEKCLIVIMIGLPARGKSYISRRLTRFLQWHGFLPRIFNIGNYRRKIVGHDKDSKFFDQSNQEFNKLRETCAMEALADLTKFINQYDSTESMNIYNPSETYHLDELRIAILDGTNTTYQRRELIFNYLKDHVKVKYELIWIECIATLNSIIEKNIYGNKIKSPDYIQWTDREKAAQDFRDRIAEYEKVYQTINPDEEKIVDRYIKLINEGQKFIMNNVSGYLETMMVSYLVNLHSGKRPIYFTAHGESLYNSMNLIGGDSDLSPKGRLYSEGLAKFLEEEFKDYDSSTQPNLYCSYLKRGRQTAQILCEKTKHFGGYIPEMILNEINYGIYDGMTYDEFEKSYPEDFSEVSKGMLYYRYPRGESFMDVIHRIRPIIYEIERIDSPCVVISHVEALRCLYGYFSNMPVERIPQMEMDLHVVIKFVPMDYGFSEERFRIDPETHKVEKIVGFEKFTDHYVPISK